MAKKNFSKKEHHPLLKKKNLHYIFNVIPFKVIVRKVHAEAKIIFHFFLSLSSSNLSLVEEFNYIGIGGPIGPNG